jgi:hypothetical protein
VWQQLSTAAAALIAHYAAALLAFASCSRFAFSSSNSFCNLLSRRETLWSQKSRPVRLVSPVFNLYNPLSPTPATDIITVMMTSGGTDWPGIIMSAQTQMKSAKRSVSANALIVGNALHCEAPDTINVTLCCSTHSKRSPTMQQQVTRQNIKHTPLRREVGVCIYTVTKALHSCEADRKPKLRVKWVQLIHVLNG